MRGAKDRLSPGIVRTERGLSVSGLFTLRFQGYLRPCLCSTLNHLEFHASTSQVPPENVAQTSGNPDRANQVCATSAKVHKQGLERKITARSQWFCHCCHLHALTPSLSCHELLKRSVSPHYAPTSSLLKTAQGPPSG